MGGGMGARKLSQGDLDYHNIRGGIDDERCMTAGGWDGVAQGDVVIGGQICHPSVLLGGPGKLLSGPLITCHRPAHPEELWQADTSSSSLWPQGQCRQQRLLQGVNLHRTAQCIR